MAAEDRTVRIVAKARSDIDRVNKHLRQAKKLQKELSAHGDIDVDINVYYAELAEAGREAARLERKLQKAKFDPKVNVSDEEIRRLQELGNLAASREETIKLYVQSREAEQRVAKLQENMTRWRQMQAAIADDASDKEIAALYSRIEGEQRKVLASSRELADEIGQMDLPRGFNKASGDISRFNRNLESSIKRSRRLGEEAEGRVSQYNAVSEALSRMAKQEEAASRALERNFARAEKSVKGVTDRLFKFEQQIQRAFTEIDPSNMERDFGKIRANLASFFDELEIKGRDFRFEGLDDFARQIDDAKGRVEDLRASIREGEIDIPADIQLARFEAKKEKIRRDIAAARQLQLIVFSDIETDRFEQSYSSLKRMIRDVEGEIIRVQAEFDIEDPDLSSMRDEITGLSDARIKVAADVSDAESDLKGTVALAKLVDRTRATLRIDSDTRKLHTTIVSLGMLTTGIGKASDAFENRLNRSMRLMNNIFQILIRLAIVFVFSALTPLTAGFLALAGAVGLGAAAFGAVALAAAPLVSSLANHEQASKNLEAAQESLAAAQEAAADSQKAYADAQVEGARAIKDAQESVADAREAVADAEEEGNRGIRDAIVSYRDAQRSLAQTEVDTRRDVAEAARAYADAQREYAEAEVEARERVAEAVEALREAEEELADTRKEVASDIRESYEEYLEAERAIGDVRREVARESVEADREIIEARRDLTETIEDTQDSINDAYESWRDSVRAVAEAERDAREEVAEAVETHREALEELSDVRREAAEYVRDTHADAREAVRDLREAEEDLFEARDRLRETTRDFVVAQEDLNKALRGEPTTIREMELELDAQRLDAIDLAQRRADAEESLRQAMSVGDLDQVRRLELEIAQIRNQQQRDIIDQQKNEDALKDARKNGSDELNSAWDDLESAYDARQDAEQGLIDSQLRLQDSQRKAAEAQIKAAEAQTVAARMIADALKDVMEAEEGVSEAERNGAKSVREARERASEQYESYRDSIEDGAEAIRQAESGVTDAIRRRNDVQRSGQQRIREAQERAREAYSRYRDTQIEGAERILDAEERVAEAREGVADAVAEGREIVRDAYRRMGDAARAYRQAEVNRSRQIRAAMQSVRQADAAVSDARVQKAEMVEDAQDSLRDAIEDLRDTERDTYENIQQAFEDMQDAAEEVKKAMEDVTEAAKEPGARLRPWEQAVLDRWEKFKKGITKQLLPASKELAGILIEVMDFGSRYFPLVGEMTLGTVEAIGRGVDHFFELLNRPRSMRSIEKIAEYVPIFTEDLAIAAGELGTALINMLAEVAPEATKFAGWVRRITRRFREWTEGDMPGALKRIFEDAEPFFEQAKDTIEAVWELLIDIASDPKVQKFSTRFLNLIETIADNSHVVIGPLRALSDLMGWIAAAADTTGGRWFLQAAGFVLAFNLLGGSAVIAGMKALGGVLFAIWKYRKASSVMGKLATSMDDFAAAQKKMPSGGVGPTLGSPTFDTSTRNAKTQATRLSRFMGLVRSLVGPLILVAAIVYAFDEQAAEKARERAEDEGYGLGQQYSAYFKEGVKSAPILGGIATWLDDLQRKWWARLAGVKEEDLPPNPIILMIEFYLTKFGLWLSGEGKKKNEDVGGGIWDGIIEGLRQAILNSPFGTIFKLALAAMKAWWGIKSPSTKAAGQVGKPIALGILKGIADWLIPDWLANFMRRFLGRGKKGADEKNKNIKWGSIGSFILRAIVSKIPGGGLALRLIDMLTKGKKRGDEKNQNIKWGGIGAFILRTILSKLPGGGIALRIISMLTKGKSRGDEKNQNIKWGAIGGFILRTILSKIPGAGIALRIIRMLTQGKQRGDEKNQNIKWGAIGGYILRTILSKIPGGGIALRIISMLTKGKARGDEKNQNIKWGGIGAFILRTILSKLPGGGIALRLLGMIGKGKERADEKNEKTKWGGIGGYIWNAIKARIPIFGLGTRLAEMLGEGKEKADEKNERIEWGTLGSGIIGDVLKGARERWPDFVDWLKDIGGGDWAKPAFAPLGYNMLAGIMQGMDNRGPGLIEKAYNWVKNAAESMRKASQEGSPSRLTMPTGANMIRGLMVGMDDIGPEAARKAAELVERIHAAMGRGEPPSGVADAARREADRMRSLIDLEKKRGEALKRRLVFEAEAARRQADQLRSARASERRRALEYRTARRASNLASSSTPRHLAPRQAERRTPARPPDAGGGEGRRGGGGRADRRGVHDTVTLDFKNLPAEAAKHIQPETIVNMLNMRIKREQKTEE